MGAGAVTLNGQTLATRYVRIYPKVHPGSLAPLGWSLSPSARSELLNQLVTQNAGAIDSVREWLTGNLACP